MRTYGISSIIVCAFGPATMHGRNTQAFVRLELTSACPSTPSTSAF